jgi:curli biogenesis system outer membrane secretion channel CsgG
MYTTLCIYRVLSVSLVCVKVRDSEILASVQGQGKMTQVLDAFGLLYFTILRSVLAGRAY